MGDELVEIGIRYVPLRQGVAHPGQTGLEPFSVLRHRVHHVARIVVLSLVPRVVVGRPGLRTGLLPGARLEIRDHLLRGALTFAHELRVRSAGKDLARRGPAAKNPAQEAHWGDSTFALHPDLRGRAR